MGASLLDQTTTAMPATLSPAETHRRVSGGEAAELIDVRTPAEFAAQHAVGAHSLPLDQLNAAAFLSERKGKGTRPIYLLCQGGKRATMAAEKLAAAGCGDAVVVEGGTTAWAAAGLPCESSGRKVMSLERQVRIAAGALVLGGVLLGWCVHPLFVWLSGFVGAGLMFSGISDTCTMGMLIAKMPWNQAK